MTDLVFLTLAGAFFVLAWGLVRLAESQRPEGESR